MALTLLSLVTAAGAQTTATLAGRVVDQQGGGLPGAVVTLSHPITGLELTAVADDDAVFRLANIPLQTYRLIVSFPGFRPAAREVALRTSVPVRLEVVLDIAAQHDTVTVSAISSAPLVDATLTGTRTREPGNDRSDALGHG